VNVSGNNTWGRPAASAGGRAELALPTVPAAPSHRVSNAADTWTCSTVTKRSPRLTRCGRHADPPKKTHLQRPTTFTAGVSTSRATRRWHQMPPMPSAPHQHDPGAVILGAHRQRHSQCDAAPRRLALLREPFGNRHSSRHHDHGDCLGDRGHPLQERDPGGTVALTFSDTFPAQLRRLTRPPCRSAPRQLRSPRALHGLPRSHGRGVTSRQRTQRRFSQVETETLAGVAPAPRSSGASMAPRPRRFLHPSWACRRRHRIQTASIWSPSDHRRPGAVPAP